MFKFESFDMFDEMTASIRENTVFQMFNVVVRKNEAIKREQVAKVTGTSGGSDEAQKPKTVRKGERTGPNEPALAVVVKIQKCCMLKDENK